MARYESASDAAGTPQQLWMHKDPPGSMVTVRQPGSTKERLAEHTETGDAVVKADLSLPKGS